ncbi:hypothetical protein B0H16DRAFT_1766746 [Mycena metata]|uniref:Uncharacterized protein n=1 Tax=Mycena metata TaxID=1033252 RepID=A0AAD7K133_9AGAR|nr:hypothetical protein B0H16DRAFT_1766746 [Mycena metata]
MPFSPRDIPVDAFYSQTARDPLPTVFAGAIGTSYNGYPQSGYNFGTAQSSYYPSHPSYPSPPPSHHHGQSVHRAPHAANDPSYSPSRFVQPSLNTQSYGFPAAPQSTAQGYGMPSPLGRRNSVVDHPPRPRPPISDYSTLAGAVDGYAGGPTRSIQKHALTSPYKSGSRPRSNSIVAAAATPKPPRRGSKQIGPCLPDGPSDYMRLPQEAYEEPVTELGYQRIDHHRLQPIVFKNPRSATPGIRLGDYNCDSLPPLERPDDRIFDGVFHFREAKIRVLWPGYPPLEKRFKTPDARRSTLFVMVVNAIGQMMHTAVNKKLSPKRGFEAWSIARRPNGAPGLCPEDVLVTGIEHRGGANFQVELWIATRKMGVE